MNNHPPDPASVAALRLLIDGFIQSRLDAKLEKLKDPDPAQRQAVLDEHHRATWLADAARRATQIQLATHTLKPIHPDARGSTVYLDRPVCSDPALVGSHILAEPHDDVVGNAAALDVYKLLKLAHDGESLLARARRNDSALRAAMAGDQRPESMQAATDWITGFASLAMADAAPATHSLAKQLFFPLADGDYHLLAPLFPTALVQHWHLRQVEDRFSDASKSAREDKRAERMPMDGKGYLDYPGLAVQKFGGTKPQNISQLNSERRGDAHLLAALPPVWQAGAVRLPLKTASVFAVNGVLSRRFAAQVKVLRRFLVAVNQGHDKNRSILAWREERARQVDQLVDEIQAWAAGVQIARPGWSQSADCLLEDSERRWLDPYAPAVPDKAGLKKARSEAAAEALSDEDAALLSYLDEDTEADDAREAKALASERDIADAFARWLDRSLETKDTPMDDATHREWAQRWLALPVEAAHAE